MIRHLRHFLLFLALTGHALAQSFSISVSPESRIVAAGERTTFTISVTPHDGFAASVFLRYHSSDFAASEISLDLPKINSPYTTTATLSVTPRPGSVATRQIVFEGRNADLVVTDTVSLTVVVPPGKDQWITYDTANSILPSNTIFDIAFDRHDIPWIGTKKGLVRLDPNAPTLFDKTNAPFGSESILAIAIDSNNGVWVSTFDDYATDIYCYREGIWTTFKSDIAGLRGINKTSIAIAADSTVWMSTHKGVMKFHRGEWSIYSMANSGLTWDFTGHVAVTPSGDLWVSAGLSTQDPDNRSLMKFDGRFWTAYSLADLGLERADYFSALAIDASSGVWLASRTTLVGVNGPNIRSLRLSEDFFNGWRALAVGRNGVVWFSQPTNSGSELGGWNGAALIRYGPDNSGLPTGIQIERIAPRRDGSIWLATWFHGMLVFRPAVVPSAVLEPAGDRNSFRFQVTPNPLPSRGRLELTSGGGSARITLHNIMGERVALLYEGDLPVGRRFVDVDLEGVASGAYLLMLNQAGRVSCSQVIIGDR